MSEYAQVKYVTDGVRATVPSGHFKVVFMNLIEPKELAIGNIYQVFWSPEQEETPADVMESNYEILDIDDLPEMERSRKRRQNGGPLKGFYNALLLSLSYTDDIEREMKREISGSNCLDSGVKRTKVPSNKALESNPKFKTSVKTVNPKHVSKKIQKEASLEACKRNLTSLFKKCETSSRKGKMSRDKGEEYQSKNKCTEATEKSQKSKVTVTATASTSKVKDSWSNRDLNESSNTTQNDCDKDFDDVQDTGSNSSNSSSSNSVQKGKEKESEEKSQIYSDESSFDDSDDDEQPPKKIHRAIPSGKEGDSLALYQFVDKLWDQKTLIKRSPTGLAACSKNQKIGYPRMTPKKVKQCEEFVKNRVLQEKSDASQAEIDLRVGRTRYILGQKIASLRKSYRRKGIPVPSAEEAKAERKELKKERKQHK